MDHITYTKSNSQCHIHLIIRFEIGPSVRPCTKGLWVWGAPISLKNEHGSFRLLLVDTEGLGSFKAKETYDHQVSKGDKII